MTFPNEKEACSMPAASGYKGINEIKGKKRELSFHPHFIYEGLTSLLIEAESSVK